MYVCMAGVSNSLWRLKKIGFVIAVRSTGVFRAVERWGFIKLAISGIGYFCKFLFTYSYLCYICNLVYFRLKIHRMKSIVQFRTYVCIGFKNSGADFTTQSIPTACVKIESVFIGFQLQVRDFNAAFGSRTIYSKSLMHVVLVSCRIERIGNSRVSKLISRRVIRIDLTCHSLIGVTGV